MFTNPFSRLFEQADWSRAETHVSCSTARRPALGPAVGPALGPALGHAAAQSLFGPGQLGLEDPSFHCYKEMSSQQSNC